MGNHSILLVFLLLAVVIPLGSLAQQGGDRGRSQGQGGGSRQSNFQWEKIIVEASDGTKTPAFYTVPAGNGPFPTVVFFHGAPGGIGEERLQKFLTSWHWIPFVEAGYVVCVSDYRGHAENQPGDILQKKPGGADDAIAVINHLKSFPKVDSKRIVVNGQSLGGAITLETVSREEVQIHVACAVLTAPALLLFNQADRANGTSMSQRIEKIKCPVFFVMGTGDGLTVENQKVYDSMKRAQKDVRIELFEKEGHGFINGVERETEAAKKAVASIVAFIGEHVKK